jgi:bacterial/archaeal transporter family-2 protein
MQSLVWPAALTVGAGVSVMVQQALNANLRAELSSAAWSGFVSYFVGVLCMIVLALALRDPVPSTATLARVPLWLGAAAYLARSSLRTQSSRSPNWAAPHTSPS